MNSPLATLNTQWRLIARPAGEVGREHFQVTRPPLPEPGLGEVRVRNLYLLIPPSMRLWMNEKETYFPPQPLGEVMAGITLGVVESSQDPSLVPGDYVNGLGGCQEWFVAPAAQLQKISPRPGVPLAAYRSVLDVQGLTAWCGLTEIGRPQAGETLVVTAAAGSVGSLVCQIGKRLGLRVIGIAGGAEKCAWLRDECGVDGVIDYRHDDVAARLDALCPEGIDIVYENVGGPVMDMLIERLRFKGRVVLCGLVSSYNGGVTQNTGSLMTLVNKAARMEGFLVSEYLHRYQEVVGTLQEWVADGSLKYQIEVLEGLDSVVDAIGRVFRGQNRGVQLVKISDEGQR
ncbi:NADP-dependent oxidoreductase [Zoogloea sp.]|uniref:NADP-dependent oxidoreductase n=1 Tax=Zoogloea sp. TaxID=49181 RepID=UPI0026243B55|nr:NADP-dependent oxidoreductase [Zoogloea sp.]MDD3353826.1 NADP-dependent oxidoreductase [Zoogloea sp.]